MNSVVDGIAFALNYIGASLRHTRDETLDIVSVELIPVALDLFEEVLIVALSFAHLSVEFAPQVFDRIQIG